MKLLFNYTFALLAAGLMTFGLASCSSDSDGNSGVTAREEETFLRSTLTQYVNNTVAPTYKSMAENATSLYQQMKTLRSAVVSGSATEAMVNAACQSWLKARADYEASEAFLLGAASDYDIDPHIDTWPLDLTALHQYLVSPKMLAQFITDDDEENVAAAHSALNQTLLGFHALEFVIFRDGKPRDVSSFNNTYDNYQAEGVDYTDVKNLDELKYAVTVAGDLMYSIYELEVCWTGGTAAHKQALEDLEWKTAMPSSDNTYGWNMQNAGKSGSTYTSVKGAVSAIISGDNGCAGIIDEVGQTKMGKPYGLGTNSENGQSDPNYIESPFSHNSLTDFWHNVQSIADTWYGKYDVDNQSSAVASNSFSAYFKKYSPATGAKVEAAIADAQAKIKACPAPFVTNYQSSSVKTAIDACTALKNALNEANDYIQKQK